MCVHAGVFTYALFCESILRAAEVPPARPPRAPASTCAAPPQALFPDMTPIQAFKTVGLPLVCHAVLRAHCGRAGPPLAC